MFFEVVISTVGLLLLIQVVRSVYKKKPLDQMELEPLDARDIDYLDDIYFKTQ